MAFQTVSGKMGNMRKADEWVVYPRKSPEDTEVTIQCERRIARVNLATGKAMLSDGKGGHQGFHKLMPLLGAKEVDCPPEMLETLKALPIQTGSVRVL